jgi:hypothetical protein
MAHSYTVRMPDGKEYGPADLEALQAWQKEGRITADTLVWKQGDHDWRPLSQVLDTGEIRAKPVVDDGATLAARPSPFADKAPAADPVAVTVAMPAAHAAVAATAEPEAKPEGATVPMRVRPTSPGRTARRPRPSPLRIVVPLVVALALVAGLVFWWRSGQAERDRREAEATIRAYAAAERQYADDGLGLQMGVPDGWIVLRPANPFFHAPDARVRLAQPVLGAFARLNAESRDVSAASLDDVLNRAVANWKLIAPGLQEEGRSDASASGTPARRAVTTWSAEDQAFRGSMTVWKDGWNEFALAVWGRAADATAVTASADALLAQVRMAGTAMARVRSAADAVAPEIPELSREAVEALVEDRLAKGRPTEDLPQTSVRAVSRGLRALSPEESQEMGRIYLQVYKPLKDKEKAQLAAWLGAVRGGARANAEEDLAMRAILRDGILALPEDVRARLVALNDKAVRASLAR